MTPSPFPSCDVLKDGIFLHAIVNATMTAAHSYFASLLSWDCRNFVLNDNDGSYGAVTFDPKGVVAVFFDAHSDLSPFKTGPKRNLEAFFSGIPADLWHIAQSETLNFNRQYFKGEYVSVVTAAFWSLGQRLESAYSWHDVLKHGAHVLNVELTTKPEEALVQWKDAYEMTTEQARFAQAVFERRVRATEQTTLSPVGIEWLKATAESKEALEASLAAFHAMGVAFE